ncbi:MAG TPA: dihydrofolate reductase family protein [Solirubrobacterales bacterium]|nr:dihydrofolate reductase family protein [Solirubrobacterales bacterium]
MAKLIYSMQTSLDGYVNDEKGEFGWAAPGAEVHSFFNELERPVGIHLYGRRMYEVMRYWQDPPDLAEQPPHIREYAEIWQAADKVVYSTSLDTAPTPRTRLEREFEPEAIRAMKEGAAADLSLGGPTLAATALRAGLVDELHQVLYPVVVGGGTAWLPDDLHLELDLLDERRFGGGAVHLHYRTRA